MNLTNAPMYTNEVAPMRRGNSYGLHGNDAIKKLVFVYPMMLDQNLATVPFNTIVKGDADNLGDLARAFFSISVLKEIFVSNTLNLITTASTYESQKIGPSTSQNLIGSMLRGDVSNRYDAVSYPNQQQVYNNIDVNTLQNKVSERTKQLKMLLKSNPRLKKLNPFMQVITLQNMIDVPVITGTTSMQIDSASLFTVLAAAIASRSKLNSWESVQRVFNRIKNMEDEKVYNIFQVLKNLDEKSPVPDEILSSNLIGNKESEFERLQREIADESNVMKARELRKQLDGVLVKYAKQNIDRLKRTKIKELEINFRLALDPDQLALRYGYAPELSDATRVLSSKKVKPQTNLLFNKTKEQFLDFFIGADPIFNATYMLFSPATPVAGGWENPGRDFLSMRREMIDRLSNTYDAFFGSLRGEFDAKMSESLETSILSINDMKKSCITAKEEFIALINYFNQQMANARIPSVISFDAISNFSEIIDSVNQKFFIINKNVKASLAQFFGKDNFNRIDNSIYNLLQNTIDPYFVTFNSTKDPNSNLQAKLYAVNADLGRDVITERQHTLLLGSLMGATRLILETMFLLIFKINLCDFVEVADVEFQVAESNILETPNFCLVLPIEVINALHVLYTNMNWVDAVVKSGSGFNPLNASNVKSVVKLLTTRLGIPNLIVIDKKRNEMIYSFSYLGNNAEKLKLSAVETFVKYHLQNDEEGGITQLYY